MRQVPVQRWAVIGLVVQAVFGLSWVVAGLWQGDRYGWVSQSISDRHAAGAPRGLFRVVVLTACGLGTVLVALLSTLDLVLAGTAGFLLAYAMSRLPAWRCASGPSGPAPSIVVLVLPRAVLRRQAAGSEVPVSRS